MNKVIAVVLLLGIVFAFAEKITSKNTTWLGKYLTRAAKGEGIPKIPQEKIPNSHGGIRNPKNLSRITPRRKGLGAI